ncbi:MAG: ABC transporter permease, partial [Hyphomicrobiales bacterium]
MSAIAQGKAAVIVPPLAKSPGYWSGVWRRFKKDKVAVGAGLVVLAIILMAIFADYIAPADPTRSSMLRRLRPIGTPGYPLGADELGRDMLSRLIHGARLSLFMGVVPVFIAFIIGSVIGVAAGFFGGKFNTITMRTVDVFNAIPSLLLAIAHFVASQPGAVTALPAFSPVPFVFFVLGMLWLALWSGKIRVWGCLPAVMGLALMIATPTPDILVTGDGQHVG